MTPPMHIAALLATGDADRIALTAPARPPMRYRDLRRQMQATVSALNRRGIGRGDRVAIVLPNGPEMASAFVTIAAGATTVPLNPAFTGPEFEFQLADAGARALVLARGDDSLARGAAATLGIPVLEIEWSATDAAGTFRFAHAAAKRAPTRGGMAEADDVALVLHTSGTTARPRTVPLLHRNICASAAHISHALELTKDDRCLNVMPLFHIHGLMACIMATLHAGASVHCAPGFNALRIFAWLADADPSWYSAVPTMHQAILARAARNRKAIEKLRLRFIRSSSAALPVRVMAELEEAFGAPVIEAYAMTEAAHQMTSNPLPPKRRKPGTAGIAAGPEIAIMDRNGHHLAQGEEGEIAIRGPNVTPGYENNDDANHSAFVRGWFRTGDQGFCDSDGYITITGRIKEIINRGGEKISPREVDEALMEHEAVQQVVTFAISHPKLGEEVAAAVVLREGVEADPAAIRDFAAARLARFKVPRQVIMLDEIPRGPTGKLQRIGLAATLGLA